MPHPMTRIKKKHNFWFKSRRKFNRLLKATEQSDTGLNTKFVNVESGRTVTLKHAIKQIENGNKNYSDYQAVRNSNGTVYIRSKADGKRSNNIE